jgi:hypothetical protein
MAIKRAGFGYRQVLKHDERGAGPFSLLPVLSIPNPIILAYLYKPDIHQKCDRCKFSLVMQVRFSYLALFHRGSVFLVYSECGPFVMPCGRAGNKTRLLDLEVDSALTYFKFEQAELVS